MTFVSVTGTATAFLFFATMIPVYGQHEGQGDKQAGRQEDRQGKGASHQHERAAPQPQPHQQERAQQARPQPPAQQQRAQQTRPQPPPYQQERAQPTRPQPQYHPGQTRSQPQQQPQQGRQQPRRTQEQARTWQEQRGWAKHGGWQAHNSWQQGRAQHWSTEHRTWAQRGGYGGYYIPQDRFNLYFGRRHFFRLGALPVMYLGYPRFEYSGFSFLLVDPWPEDWSENWYASAEVYVDYDDGYYLYNRRYPQVRLAIAVQL